MIDRATCQFLLCILVSGTLAGCTSAPSRQSGNLERAASLNTQLGNGYLAQGRYDVAKEKFEKALDQNPHLAAAHAGYALMWSRLGENDKADRHFKRALRREPYNSSFLNNYGTFLCNQNRIEEAEERFLAALNDPLYDTPEYAYTNAGRCVLKNEQYDKAEGYFGKALQVNPQFDDALFQMARVYERRNQYKQAYAYMKRFERYGKHAPETLWLAIRLAEAVNDKDAAASYRLLLKNKFPDSEYAAKLRALSS